MLLHEGVQRLAAREVSLRVAPRDGALHLALEAFLAVLDRYTLADLVAPARPLARRLALVRA
ncbi:MAG: hypothetical protein A3D95_07210 [Betaproteobacteria bacterium RIFCSPHIGHO2_12_FULL_69_13]|nr:MAG: hypothetical protein A3D95_07210 [Betaproteobacteria bacterium RIFCSPHIGHO2_12_FULL_69_13]OGA69286.1 MAG: hypothetical protein A3G83_04750 [Betaproteobacteria bacterium RIFCSPLOWO2_12_FULL_68_20]